MRGNTVFIYWAKQSRRAENLATSAFNCELKKFNYIISKYKVLKPLDYGVKFLATINYLYKEKPSLVICQAGPMLAALAVSIYCKHKKTKLIIDCHTRVFTSKNIVLFKKYTFKSAILIIVHNYHIKDLALKYSSKVEILYDYLPYQQDNKNLSVAGDMKFIFMPSVVDDNLKIIKLLHEVAAETDLKIIITGNIILNKSTDNIISTGFISKEEYKTVLRSAAAMLIFMTRSDHDYVQPGRLIEALALGKPAIHSASVAAKEMVGKGVIFIDTMNTSQIISAMNHLRDNYDQMLADILNERGVFEKKWQNQFDRVQEYLN